MLKSSKHVFWEALVITITIFILGLLLGIWIETGNTNKVASFYTSSEINLVDAMTVLNLAKDLEVSCEVLKKENIDFANRVYEEAKLLEEYESSEKLTNELESLHRKYDLLRTLLWISNQESIEKCDNYNLIVYLYEFDATDRTQKATQSVWSKILLEAREEKGDDILLIPIAVDQDLTSLELLVEDFEVESFPAVIINNNEILYEIGSKGDILELVN